MEIDKQILHMVFYFMKDEILKKILMKLFIIIKKLHRLIINMPKTILELFSKTVLAMKLTKILDYLLNILKNQSNKIKIVYRCII